MKLKFLDLIKIFPFFTYAMRVLLIFRLKTKRLKDYTTYDFFDLVQNRSIDYPTYDFSDLLTKG